jgi:hypothetical protein
MAHVNTVFTVPCPIDRAVLAIQDTLDQFGWPILEVSTSLVVAQGPAQNALHTYNFPKVSCKLVERQSETQIKVSVSTVGPLFGVKKYLTGILGRLVNSVSLRVQTESIAINPTVALGDGQRSSSTGSAVTGEARDRAQQLKDLTDLLDRGALTEDEFVSEKRRILSSS